MICNYPNCDCRLDLPHGQLYPHQGQCPLCEKVRTRLGLDALEFSLYELFCRENRVWGDLDCIARLEDQFDRFQRLIVHATEQYRRRTCAHS